MTDAIIVMYAGKVFESAPTAELFARPANPYTKGLLRSVPDPTREDGRAVSDSRAAARRRAPAARLSVRAALRPRRGRSAARSFRRSSSSHPGITRSATSPRRSTRRPAGAESTGDVDAERPLVSIAGPEGALRSRRRHAVGPRSRGGSRGRRESSKRGRRVARHSARRDARPGRRIRLRQDDARPRDPAAGRADRRARAASAAWTSRACRRARCARSAGTCR